MIPDIVERWNVGISPGKVSQAFVRDRGLTVQMEDGDVAGLFAETVCKLPVPVSCLIQWSIADSSGISAWLFDFWERVLTRMVVRDGYTVIRESNIGYHRNKKRNRKLQEAPNDLIMTLYQMASSNPAGVLAAGSKILHVRSRG